MQHIKFRHETRYPGYHYRMDYNFIDDNNWKCFVNSKYDRQHRQVGDEEGPVHAVDQVNVRGASRSDTEPGGKPPGLFLCAYRGLVTSIETRRFSARPSRVRSSAICSRSPLPSVRTTSASTPLLTK